MTGSPADSSVQVIESAWLDQATWSETANLLKKDLTAWRNRAAAAGVLGASLETLAAMLDGPDGNIWWLRALIALSGAVILAVVPFVLKTKVSKDQVSAWVRARSVSEALKETIYRYLIRAPPFGPASTAADLVQRCQMLKDKVQDLCGYAAVTQPQKKERPLSLTVDDYVSTRVRDQVEKYYIPKARENALAAKKLHNIEFCLGLSAVVLGAVAGAATMTIIPELSAVGPWVAVVTTAGAAVTAHIASSRYDHNAMTYFSTANRLTGLRDAWLADPQPHDPARVARFVDECEHAISTENEAWLAEWTHGERKTEGSVLPQNG